jgi:hypothetical protein
MPEPEPVLGDLVSRGVGAIEAVSPTGDQTVAAHPSSSVGVRIAESVGAHVGLRVHHEGVALGLHEFAEGGHGLRLTQRAPGPAIPAHMAARVVAVTHDV